ncbi:acyltransferase [Pseudonocardia sp. NPDC049635]|uniref:acyltransferase family protein n=1 Tax=Pseudonocardia sp. NPDC049635 TaxID=3155506 RepID=UPI003403ED72
MTSARRTLPDHTTARDTGHVPALDGLRGVAVLGVLLFHSDLLVGGFLGVDLFFVLSGYLITGALLREIAGRGGVSLAAFWSRRARRLLPALAAVLVVVPVAVLAVGSPQEQATTRADGPWVQLNLLNWHLLAQEASYWQRFGAERPFGHLWSIAVEEQFYLVWPVLLLGVAAVARRGGPRAGTSIAVLAPALAIGSLALMIMLFDPADPTRVYTGTDTRAFSLLLGAFSATPVARAAVARTAAHRGGTSAAAATAVLAVALGVSWALVDGQQAPGLFTGLLFAHALASAALISLCVHQPDRLVARALAMAPLRYLGRISYSLYLWHWPVLVLLSAQRTGLDGPVVTALGWLVSMALAVATTHLIEDPIRFRADWARGRSGALACAAVMACLALWWPVLEWVAPGPAPVDVSRLG